MESNMTTRMNMRKLSFAIALFLVASAASAQDPEIRFERLSLQEGLSQVTVLSIHEDSRGFIWIGTEDGLNRFDGDSITVYRHDPADPSSLPASYIRSIDEDANGRLWIGTEGGGVARGIPPPIASSATAKRRGRPHRAWPTTTSRLFWSTAEAGSGWGSAMRGSSESTRARGRPRASTSGAGRSGLPGAYARRAGLRRT